VARDVGYIDDRIRRAMQPTLQSILVATPEQLLQPSSTNFVSWTIIEGLRKECETRGVTIEPVVNGGDRLDERLVLSRIRDSKANGIVIYFDENPAILAAVAKLERPVVLLAGQDPAMRVGSVGIGNRYGARLGTQYLLDLGHRKIGLVSWPGRYTIRQREDGYREAIGEAARRGAREHIIRVESFEPEVAERDMRAWLAESGGLGDLTALFCLADNIAIGVVRALNAAGIAVPGDVSVLGFDDILPGQMMQPSLTTVHAPLTHIGATALDELEYHLRAGGSTGPVRRVELGCTIVERASCAVCRQ